MAQPERDKSDGYQPTLKDRDTVKFLFDSLFLGVPPVAKPERNSQSRFRLWKRDSMTVFNAGITQPVHTTGADEGVVTIVRKTMSADYLIELRVYEYFVETGELQVANETYTQEELIKASSDKEARAAVSNGVIEGLMQKIYTPSRLEYLEFLEDVDSFHGL